MVLAHGSKPLQPKIASVYACSSPPSILGRVLMHSQMMEAKHCLSLHPHGYVLKGGILEIGHCHVTHDSYPPVN